MTTDIRPGLSIAEAAEHTGLTAHTLRYYERDGLLLAAVDRSASGHRRYSARDLTWIEMITRLRSTGMPMRDVRRYAALVRGDAAPAGHRPQDRPLRGQARAGLLTGLTWSALEVVEWVA